MSNRPTLAALLRDRSRHDVAAFVAALYDARGALTRADRGVAVVDGERYAVVSAGYRGRLRERVLPDADHVVAVDATRADTLEARYGVPVLTPADFDRLARYGLDRPAADAVFTEWFDRAVDDVALPGRRTRDGGAVRSTALPPSTTSADATDGRRRPVQPVVVAALLVGAVAAFALAIPPSAGGSLGGLAEVGGSTTPAAPGAGTDEAGVANEPRPAASAEALGLAPGLSVDGVTDSKALADAHARAMANRSYTWELTYVEFVNGNETGRATERVSVARPSVYVSNVSTDGFLTARGPISLRPSYADGTDRHRPTADGVDTSPVRERDVGGLQESRARQYLELLLDGEETAVVRTILGGPRLYVVDVEGTSAGSVRNYTATAHVAPDGAVLYYSGSYCFVPLRSDDIQERCLSLTMQYHDVGETSVDPPAWYVDASETPEASTPTTETPTPTTERESTVSRP